MGKSSYFLIILLKVVIHAYDHLRVISKFSQDHVDKICKVNHHNSLKSLEAFLKTQLRQKNWMKWMTFWSSLFKAGIHKFSSFYLNILEIWGFLCYVEYLDSKSRKYVFIYLFISTLDNLIFFCFDFLKMNKQYS